MEAEGFFLRALNGVRNAEHQLTSSLNAGSIENAHEQVKSAALRRQLRSAIQQDRRSTNPPQVGQNRSR